MKTIPVSNSLYQNVPIVVHASISKDSIEGEIAAIALRQLVH
jgi:hypothetical protein